MAPSVVAASASFGPRASVSASVAAVAAAMVCWGCLPLCSSGWVVAMSTVLSASSSLRISRAAVNLVVSSG